MSIKEDVDRAGFDEYHEHQGPINTDDLCSHDAVNSGILR